MEKIITPEDLASFSFRPEEVECVRFEQCDLSGLDLSSVIFIECTFSDCNLSNANLSRTSFRECSFITCKLVGLRFDDCIPFLQPPIFKNCDLKLASFTSIKLHSVHFERCKLHEADFTNADLSNAVFSESDLNGAIFQNTDLRQADLQTSFHYSIDPERNRIKHLKVIRDGLAGFLDKYELDIQ